MDFFQSQEIARRNTFGLVIFFSLAVISLIVITNLLVLVILGYMNSGEEGWDFGSMAAQFDWQVFGIISVVIALVIMAGSLYKTMILSRGGSAVAESIGGRLIHHNTKILDEQRVLNVVEEMAIAAGTPVPPVYLLAEEDGINAFAAGYSPGDAVIGVTQGTINHLKREELQGVIAHEFSHVFNGDMRLNMKLICILHGILLIGLIGYYLLRSLRSSKNSAPFVALGLGLVTIGYSGTFFGNLIKAAVNRQREYLADASAVQFTRNKYGIANALKKIGSHASGSQLQSPQAPSVSHAYFCTGVKSFLKSIMATHPPLAARIKRIDPQWDGVYRTESRKVSAANKVVRPTEAISKTDPLGGAVGAAAVASHLLDSVGKINPEQLGYAAMLVNEIPTAIREAVHEPYGARAIIYCLVINRQPEIEKKQLKRLEDFGDQGIYALVNKLLGTVKALDIRLRLPLIDMALPSMRQLSQSQYQSFRENLRYLIKIDNLTDSFEWSLQKILFHHLDPQFKKTVRPKAQSQTLKGLKDHINILLTSLVRVCVTDKSLITAAFAKAEKELGISGIMLLSTKQINIGTLDMALDHLVRLKPLFKQHLLKACLAILTHDQDYAPNEVEFMRAIAAALECPLPPSPLVQKTR